MRQTFWEASLNASPFADETKAAPQRTNQYKPNQPQTKREGFVWGSLFQLAHVPLFA